MFHGLFHSPLVWAGTHELAQGHVRVFVTLIVGPPVFVSLENALCVELTRMSLKDNQYIRGMRDGGYGKDWNHWDS